MIDVDRLKRWTPPAGWTRITTVDLHTEGEPFRVVTGGMPDLPGATILEKRRYMKDHFDHLRTALMWEPRGHADMYGCIVTPPTTAGADFGVLFLHNEGYSTMCGHGIIGIATAVIETGAVAAAPPVTTLAIEAPAGRITAHVRVAGGRAASVFFENVPSFVLAQDETVTVPGIGPVTCDIAFGGAFYAVVAAERVGLSTEPGDLADLVKTGMAVKRAVMAHRRVEHPFEPDLSFLYGTIFTGPPTSEGVHSRNVCVFAEGEVDRCPTGTGVSARLAARHARGEIATGEPMIVESILGTRFTGRVIKTTRFGPHEAVIPQVEGTAKITGRHSFLIDPDDPLKDGFLLR
jgi:trans-L-3-hydroxyproline dehydratase